MIPDKVYILCRSSDSVTNELVKNPDQAPGDVCQKLYGKEASEPPKLESEAHTYDTQRAFECGNWGESRPSNLFLKIYEDVLQTLDKNHPLAGMCSPSLMGTNGVCPLVTIATVPDICRHMSNLIARAEHEVFLATNYWAFSEGSELLCNAIRELSKRAQASSRQVVVKVMYDRGSPMQVYNNHLPVDPKIFADPSGPIRLPHPDELPNVALEVVNYHKPPLGTFHAKYMIVDRRIAILQSNNIQSNDNLEMMTQFEGAVVDSLWDMALITWHNVLRPELPFLNSPAALAPLPTFSTGQAIPPMFDDSFFASGTNSHDDPDASALFNDDSSSEPDSNVKKIAKEAVHHPLPPHTAADPHYDPDVASEVLRAASAFVPRDGSSLISGITRTLNVPLPAQEDTRATAPEIKPSEMMTPLIPIPHHPPFPIAMVNREPYGPPTHASLHVPQNAAFTSALRNATASVFIQTPNLNATALLPELLAACRRGVKVTYFYCLGYNDAGELLPMQGGHNEGIAHSLYRQLEPEFHANLNIHAYVAKDQIRPIHNAFKRRSCHIKLMIVDGHIGIQGSGNQDTQSWYHSQEVNVMIDSALVVGEWMKGIKQNQNTHLYGQVQKEGELAGCWLDKETGQMVDGAIGVDPGKLSWLRGMKGAVQRLKGTGGF